MNRDTSQSKMRRLKNTVTVMVNQAIKSTYKRNKMEEVSQNGDNIEMEEVDPNGPVNLYFVDVEAPSHMNSSIY